MNRFLKKRKPSNKLRWDNLDYFAWECILALGNIHRVDEVKLTTKGRYAVTAMLDLSLHYAEGSIPLADIAQRQGISLSYLEQLFSRLRKKSLVASVRGPGGGYSLGKTAEEIFIGEVISAVDENIDTTRCNGVHNCQNNERCLTHDLWSDLSNQIYSYLNKISLQDLMDRKAVRKGRGPTRSCRSR